MVAYPEDRLSREETLTIEKDTICLITPAFLLVSLLHVLVPAGKQIELSHEIRNLSIV